MSFEDAAVVFLTLFFVTLTFFVTFMLILFFATFPIACLRKAIVEDAARGKRKSVTLMMKLE
jgi:hypothetical protein